jgi:hypothetical protein
MGGKILDESRGVAAYNMVSHTSMSIYLYQMIPTNIGVQGNKLFVD